MKLAELKYIYLDTKMTRHMISNVLRHNPDKVSEEEKIERRLQLAEIELLRIELKDHLDALKRILKVCDLVSRDRYRDEWQLCQVGAHYDEDGIPTTCCEWCAGFDRRSPHRVIADTITEIQPFSADLRSWIGFQAEYHTKRHQALFGPGGLFGDARMAQAVEQPDGTVTMVPMNDEDKKGAHAAYRAQQQAHCESVAGRIDQYELNLSLIQRICDQQGPLSHVVRIIEDGMPPLSPAGLTLS
jgi:hypothetical protein